MWTRIPAKLAAALAAVCLAEKLIKLSSFLRVTVHLVEKPKNPLSFSEKKIYFAHFLSDFLQPCAGEECEVGKERLKVEQGRLMQAGKKAAKKSWKEKCGDGKGGCS